MHTCEIYENEQNIKTYYPLNRMCMEYDIMFSMPYIQIISHS